MARRRGKSSTQNLRLFNKELRGLGRDIAIEVAAFAARQLTFLARDSYGKGETCYGDPRPEGVNGPLDLIESGLTFSHLQFVSDGGTKIRASLLGRYARFLIGKYRILPIGNAALPVKWNQAIRNAAQKRIARWAEELP
jgi:hypothetical protein